MIRLDKHNRKNDIRTQVRVVEGYRDESGKMKQRTIKNFGYLEDHCNEPNFMEEVKKFDQEFKNDKKLKKQSFFIPFDQDQSSLVLNYGYYYLSAIYDSLKLDEFFSTVEYNGNHSLNDIFKYLCIQRILNPDSKRATLQNIKNLYGFNIDLQLPEIYRSLDKFSDEKINIQKYLNDRIKVLIGRDTSFAYYDVTNFYNEIDFPKSEEDIRQRGVSKEHRLEPIIQLGLFIDENSLPISMSLFKGNTSDTKTLQPVMSQIKKDYELNRLIVVADKGLNSTSNLDYIVNNGDGFVVSQMLKGKKGKRYQEHIGGDDFIVNKDGTFKYKLFEEEYTGHDKNGNAVSRKRNVLIYWKKEDAEMAKKKRDEKIEKAEKALTNNAYLIDHTKNEYIKQTHVVEETGEVAEEIINTINQERIDEDSKYDGYFCIITSELEYDYEKIMKTYGGLWRIEESFRISKSELEVRPIYVRTENHINGHFISCFVSLLMIRMLQLKMKYEISVERIVNALGSSSCLMLDGEIIRVVRNESRKEYKKEKLSFIDEDQIINDYKKIMKAFEVEIPYSKYTKKDFNKYLKTIKY